MGTRGRVIRVLAIAAAGASAGVLIGAGLLWAALEFDDGDHDIFGSDLPPVSSRGTHTSATPFDRQAPPRLHYDPSRARAR